MNTTQGPELYTGIPPIPGAFPVLVPIPIPRHHGLHQNHIRCILPHTQWLPHELLAEIFLEVAEHWYPWCYWKKLLIPLLLGHVCSTWRHVAHGTPKLWTSFSLWIRKAVEEGRVDHASIAKAWLARAHPYPLHVSLGVDATTLCSIMYAILPSAHRLQVIDLDLELTHRRPLVDLPAVFMPRLEHVHLTVDLPKYLRDKELWVARTIAFAAAPHLRNVTLSLSGLSSSKIHLPWWQFTKLDISGSLDDYGSARADLCLNAFVQCRNIVNCTLDMDVSMWHRGAAIQDIPLAILPRLQTLELFFTGGGEAYPFFEPLILPALKDLAIETLCDCEWHHPTFTEFTLRSSLDLESFRIWGASIAEDELLEFLPHMRSLVVLEISLSGDLGNQLFDTLCYCGRHSQNLVPKLKTLLLHDIQDDVDDNRIANMVESWWWTDDAPCMVSCLERVNVALGRRDIGKH